MNYIKFLVGFRKFTITVFYMLVMIIFRVLNYIDGAQFTEAMIAGIVGYLGTNIGEHLLTLGKQYIQGKFNELFQKSDESVK